MGGRGDVDSVKSSLKLKKAANDLELESNL